MTHPDDALDTLGIISLALLAAIGILLAASVLLFMGVVL